MVKIYEVKKNGNTEAITEIQCKDEDAELQRLLEKNPDLLPGDQINPVHPRRWLLIKREMPVPDPSTGSNQWNVDFLFVDQDARPTFVECKRFNDTRSRREVIAQMLDYAANGHYYWTKDELREFAEKAAKNNEVTLEEEMQRLKPEDPDELDVFFQQIQDNLREGQIRLVFFLEEAPMELKSIVDFLNKQMERSEVLLVEARQYLHEGKRFVSPTLFGYTEEARRVKRTVLIERKKWDRDSFFNEAKKRLDSNQANALLEIFEKCESLHGKFSWGTGKTTGTFSVKWPHLSNYSVIVVNSNGGLTICFGNFNKSEKDREFRDYLKELVVNKLNFSVPDKLENKYPGYKITEWAPKISTLLQMLGEISSKSPASSA